MTNALASTTQAKEEDRLALLDVGLFPELTAPDVVRPDLNLEKWPSIWRPARSRTHPKARILRREISLPDNSVLTAKVQVGFTDHGSLTTEDQRVYYALIRVWEQDGRPMGKVPFSLRGLARILKKSWGMDSRQAITKALLRLRFTGFTWTNSYYDSATKKTIRVLDTFNILSDLRLSQEEENGQVLEEKARFCFNILLLRNLLNNNTKPVFLDTILSFKSEIAQLLYSYLDLIMADKERFERRTKELFEELDLRGDEYKKKSARQRKLEKALKELKGVRLTTGVITVAKLEPTKDKQDLKIVISKAPRGFGRSPERVEKKADSPEQAFTGKVEVSEAAIEELVKYFYSLFHPRVKTIKPRKSELEVAGSLIQEHGLELSRYILEFSVSEAKKTKYNPASISGVVQYAPHALVTWEEEKCHRERRRVIRECLLCDSTGYLTFGDEKGPTFQKECPHNAEKVAAFEQREGLRLYKFTSNDSGKA